MKTAIIYYSNHHGNTKKVLDAIKAGNDVELIDVTTDKNADLAAFDRIGIASGIYYSSIAKPLAAYAREKLPEEKEVFFIGTCGSKRKGYFNEIRSITDEKKCRYLGEFLCQGFDTFGPFKLVGGIAKGHPTADELSDAVKFYESL
ncbi:MAG: flavodoxin [Clostridiales bacterium]|nr:flavodoxin [Clostridiales bacterium]MBR6483759.1 flavodoxin [Clostridiales bacterium]